MIQNVDENVKFEKADVKQKIQNIKNRFSEKRDKLEEDKRGLKKALVRMVAHGDNRASLANVNNKIASINKNLLQISMCVLLFS